VPIDAKALQYGLDMAKESDRLIAAEEVLAELAQKNPQSNFVQRAIAAIRKWLRTNIPDLANMKLTDGEIIENYLVPAREFVQQGRTAAETGGLAGAFSRRKDTRTTIANRLLAGLAQSMRIAPSQAAAAAEARKLAEPPRAEITNLSTGMKASVSKKSVKKMMDDSAVWKSASLGAHFAAIANVDKLFEVAIRHGQRPGNRQEDAENIKAVHKFDAPMPFNGEIWRVRMTVKEFVRTDPDGDRIYTLEIADVETPVLTGQPSLQVSHVHEQSTHWRTARFAQMVQIVKDGLKPDDAANPDIRFSRSTAPAGATPATVATPPFRERMERVIDTLIYNFQDRFKPLKDIQKRAGLVPEAEDAALAEERYSDKVRARIDDFEASMREPLIKAIHESKVEYDDVEEYLHALHAPSRNAAMREINPTEAELKDKVDRLTALRDSLANDADVAEYLKLGRELRQAEGDIEDGIADESLSRAIQADIAQLRKVANVRDYMNALDELKALRLVKPFQGDNTALSGMSNEEAAAVLAKIDANGTRKALERVSAIVDAITSKTRQIFIDSALEKPETIEKWNEKYEHYVPLHRDEVGGSTMPRIGQGFDIGGRESNRISQGICQGICHFLMC
jgi:hypothetical protein